MYKIWGLNANSHDAALAVFSSDGISSLAGNVRLQLEFASQSERFSGLKNDPNLHISDTLTNDLGLLDYAKIHFGKPDLVVWYEKPIKKSLRQFYSGQGWLFQENNIEKYLSNYEIHAPIKYVSHHFSHASAGYFTSSFDNAAVVVIDGIGEWETFSVWRAVNQSLTKIYSASYPHSLGLWYSALTKRVGFKAFAR